MYYFKIINVCIITKGMHVHESCICMFFVHAYTTGVGVIVICTRYQIVEHYRPVAFLLPRQRLYQSHNDFSISMNVTFAVMIKFQLPPPHFLAQLHPKNTLRKQKEIV